ncbi:prolyl-tRNA synthetase associated domain-containing protein 1 [Sarcophilus harrisii]|uniref:PrdX deacylase domain-containing protein 1 n=1 Tax=Sarcophilus harrisii TaxID=9305 RepID=G3VM57_SARHA|nr:prolyl-tRNA synthetase associated domain-containing protein 1 [Sarcophilus harrisii]
MSGTRKVTCPDCSGEGDAGEAAARMGRCAGLTRGRHPAGREGRARARGRGGKRPAHSATAAGSMAGPELRDLAIPTVSVEHPEVFTVEEMMPHIQHLKGAHSKNLFLKDKRKKNYWLVTVLHVRKINLNDLAKQLGVGSGNLRFADEISMLEKLKVGQGCATPLALFCDQGDVRFVLDSAFLEGGYEKVYFHPMTNTATMGLSPDDFLTFVKKTGHDPMIVKFN